MLDVIAFDADDTLWHNETLYAAAQGKFKKLLANYATAAEVERVLDQTETHNLGQFGYGIKAFTLSMIETAIKVSEGRIPAADIQTIIDLARDMVSAHVDLIDRAEETVAQVSASHTLMLVTKGDLFDQEAKVARSGLARHFKHIEVLTDKTRESYEALLAKHRIDPRRFVMVGNSMRSDILPVLALGARAIYIPYQITWAHEANVNLEANQERCFQLEHIGLLPELIEKLDREDEEGGHRP